ncbi:hypothetical protein FKM82_012276 [Ascaphus truei]
MRPSTCGVHSMPMWLPWKLASSDFYHHLIMADYSACFDKDRYNEQRSALCTTLTWSPYRDHIISIQIKGLIRVILRLRCIPSVYRHLFLIIFDVVMI